MVVRETTKRWIAQHISMDSDGADRVMDPRGLIKKANHTFSAKLIFLLVRHCLSPTTSSIIITWYRVVLVAAMLAGLKVDFSGYCWKSFMIGPLSPRPLTLLHV